MTTNQLYNTGKKKWFINEPSSVLLLCGCRSNSVLSEATQNRGTDQSHLCSLFSHMFELWSQREQPISKTFWYRSGWQFPASLWKVTAVWQGAQLKSLNTVWTVESDPLSYYSLRLLHFYMFLVPSTTRPSSFYCSLIMSNQPIYSSFRGISENQIHPGRQRLP